MRLVLATDAWTPQVNGVTTTLGRCRDRIEAMGNQVTVIHPGQFKTVPCPRYREINLALRPGRGVGKTLEQIRPDAVHIATEGPIGLAARGHCRRKGLAFTTSFHTQFAHYARVYLGVPTAWTYRFLRWFHHPAARTLVPTASVKQELESRGFSSIIQWSRGVDTELFRPDREPAYELARPVFLYTGRVADEKNLDAFLGLDLGGSKVVVGDGPARPRLQRRYPQVHWAGTRFGEDLARHYAGADVFVFPSRTDTFGVVMLEAAASGLPVAAYPVTGPIDVVIDGVTGSLNEDLEIACHRALELPRAPCRQHAEGLSWDRCAAMLLDNLEPISR